MMTAIPGLANLRIGRRVTRQGSPHHLTAFRLERGVRNAQVRPGVVRVVRLPGIVLAFEAIFGLPNERLTIRHDAGKGAESYVNGTLLAVRRVMQVTGLVRGLDRLLFGT
jgi:dihydrodipicolinate reductase